MTDMMTSIGISALNAAQAGLLTTGNNIANASTPGYSREQTIQAALPSLGTAKPSMSPSPPLETPTACWVGPC